MFYEFLQKVQNFVSDNKAPIIKAGSAVVGALVGGTIASLVLAEDDAFAVDPPQDLSNKVAE